MQVNEQYFDDYVIGEDRVSVGRTITETDIVMHAGQTGDFFPHHMDAEWCAQQPFGKRIAHGTLTLSVAVGMAATDINPRAMSYGYDKIRFLRPVYIGDTITVHAEISGRREYHKDPERFGIVDELVTVSNQNQQTVMVLTHVYLVERAPTQEPA